jgi:hypothetical protein
MTAQMERKGNANAKQKQKQKQKQKELFLTFLFSARLNEKLPRNTGM